MSRHHEDFAGILEADLTDDDVRFIQRVVQVFTDDRDYRLNPEHVRSVWRELRSEDASLVLWIIAHRLNRVGPQPSEGDPPP